MCVILKFTKGSGKPKESMLESASDLNKDGGGIAWIEEHNGKKVVAWKKGMDMTPKSVMKLIKERNIQLPMVIHYRIATHGKVDTPLCHPFCIDDMGEIGDYDLQSEGYAEDGVLFHNGVWRDYKEFALDLVRHNPQAKIPDGDLSDSRIMAWLVKYLGINYLSMIDEKVCVLTPEGLRTFGSGWTDVEKVECSNDNFTWGNSYGSVGSGSLNGYMSRTTGKSNFQEESRTIKAKKKSKKSKKAKEEKQVGMITRILKTEKEIEAETAQEHAVDQKLSLEEYEKLYSDNELYMSLPKEAFNNYDDWQRLVSDKLAEQRREDVD